MNLTHRSSSPVQRSALASTTSAARGGASYSPPAAFLEFVVRVRCITISTTLKVLRARRQLLAEVAPIRLALPQV